MGGKEIGKGTDGEREREKEVEKGERRVKEEEEVRG